MTHPSMTHPSYILLHVDSPPASARFYARLLGAEPVESSDTFVLFALPSGLKLGLWSKHTVEPRSGASPGAAELGFRAQDAAQVDAMHRDWAGQGVSILLPPADLDFGHSFLACDPDGHRLRVYALADG